MTALNSTDLRSQITVPRNERLIVALDVADAAEARALVEQLGDSVQFYKVGMELFMAGGYFELIDWLGERGKKVFVDLKFFDVPETVRSAIRALAKRNVAFATIHGNQAIMEAAGKEKGNLKVLAVTALTSLDRGDLDDLGFACEVDKLVLSRARRALAAGGHGHRRGLAAGRPRPPPARQRLDAVRHCLPDRARKPLEGRPQQTRKRSKNQRQRKREAPRNEICNR